MDDKPFVVKTHDIQLDSEYINWIAELKQRYQTSQIKAAVKVNSEQLLFNWQLGRDLVIRRAEEKWGSGIVEQVSLDLQHEFPNAKGFPFITPDCAKIMDLPSLNESSQPNCSRGPASRPRV